MNKSELVEWFKAHPYGLRMGAGKLSKRLKSGVSDIKEAKEMYRMGCVLVEKKMPRVLLFDLETAPMKAYVWSRWNQDITLDKTISESYILCWSAKWLYEDRVMSDTLTSEEARNEDDRRICISLWGLIDEADIVIAHNGKRADIPWMNSRFIIHGMVPPSSYSVVDTLEAARKSFGFSSNKLDAIAGYFGIEHKAGTDFQLWRDCVEGREDALGYMTYYNQKDVKILEEVYLRMRPWIKGHPNMSVLFEKDVCPHCGCSGYERIEDKYYYTTVGKYRLYRCSSCGTVFRARLGEKDYRPSNTGLR